jgi:hypothetical protein
MGWLRAHSRLGAGLALIALLLQLTLSFGHVHAAPANQVGLAITAPSESPGAPQQQPGDDHDTHYCAIYAILALLAGAQAAAAPVIATPMARAAAVASGEAVALGLIARHDSFRSRAPPIS